MNNVDRELGNRRWHHKFRIFFFSILAAFSNIFWLNFQKDTILKSTNLDIARRIHREFIDNRSLGILEASSVILLYEVWPLRTNQNKTPTPDSAILYNINFKSIEMDLTFVIFWYERIRRMFFLISASERLKRINQTQTRLKSTRFYTRICIWNGLVQAKVF